MTTCPRCSEPLATGQEYCLVCGARLREPHRYGASATSRWTLRALAAGVVAAIGAAGAIALSDSDAGGAALVTATGGFATTPRAQDGEPAGPSGVADWPNDETGWTIALAAVPQSSGRKLAVSRARTARSKGLPQVGVLDSSRYASLHPGYWIVFSGVYASEAEATSALETARRASRTAVVRRIVP